MLFFGMPVHGADFFYMDHDLLTTRYRGGDGPLVISGDIEAGDYAHLLEKIGADRNRFMTHNEIILASTDGDVGEALKIARLLRSLFTLVSVGPQTGRCVDACFLIYGAAAERVTGGDHLLGMRSSPPARAALLSDEAPSELQATMSRLTAADVYWLSTRDEQALGTRAPFFRRHLVTRCGWDEALERDVNSGRRPFSDATKQVACRTRMTRAAAYQALDLASKARPTSR